MLNPLRTARQGITRRLAARHRASGPGGLSVVAEALLDALAVFSPIHCAGCGRADRALCSDCRAGLAPVVVARPLAEFCVYTALEYSGAVRASILALKENGRTDVARLLAVPLRAALAAAVQSETSTGTALETAPGTAVETAPGTAVETATGTATVEIVSIPPSRSAWRRRGYDPVRLLCRGAGFRRSRVLAPTRHTRSQKTLDETDRTTNLAGSLRATSDLTGRRFVIVDDVLTTGATLVEAHRAISAGGGQVLCGVALAFTPRVFRHTMPAGKVHSDIDR